MTFGGLALGVGMLLDNAVVVLENIFRKREEGLPILRAAHRGDAGGGGAAHRHDDHHHGRLPAHRLHARHGRRHVPAARGRRRLLAGGLAGRRPDAHPGARGAPPRPRRGPPDAARRRCLRRFYARSEAFLAALEERYRRGVAWALAHRAQVVGGAAALFVASLLVAAASSARS